MKLIAAVDDNWAIGNKGKLLFRISEDLRRFRKLTNGHVAKTAMMAGAKLVINNDFHTPGDYVGEAQALRILMGAGLSREDALGAINNGINLFNKRLKTNG